MKDRKGLAAPFVRDRLPKLPEFPPSPELVGETQAVPFHTLSVLELVSSQNSPIVLPANPEEAGVELGGG